MKSLFYGILEKNGYFAENKGFFSPNLLVIDPKYVSLIV